MRRAKTAPLAIASKRTLSDVPPSSSDFASDYEQLVPVDSKPFFGCPGRRRDRILVKWTRPELGLQSRTRKRAFEEFNRRSDRMILPDPLQPHSRPGASSREVWKYVEGDSILGEQTRQRDKCVPDGENILQAVVEKNNVEAAAGKPIHLVHQPNHHQPRFFPAST